MTIPVAASGARRKVSQGWNAKWSQSGTTVTAVNESYNGTVGTGASVSAGFLASWSGSNPVPTAFTLNGVLCSADAEPTPTPTPTDPPDPGADPPALHVTGNKLVDADGTTRRLLGVNRSVAEFMCVQGRGIFDGPVDDASIQAIADWNADTVRIPLNEECWLGLEPMLELHWSWGQYTGNLAGCSDIHASCQKPMPNARYTPAFWTSVANTFKDDPSVVFDLFNEPYPDCATSTTTQAWQCWRDGGTCPGIGYEAAGMQDLIDAVRSTGAENVILAGGLAYSNDLSQWLTYKPSDPTGNLAAAWHVYNFNSCVNESCWNSTLAPVAAQVSLVAGEIGENTCGHSFIDQVMKWFDDRGLSCLGWTWNTWDCSSGPALITSYDGTPTSYGIGLRDHLRALHQ